MPNRRRIVDQSHPLGRFALQLQTLRQGAIARAGGSTEARALSIDKLVSEHRPWRTSRTAVYAALSGTRLPSEDAVSAMVMAWHPRPDAKARQEWLERRRVVESELASCQHQVDNQLLRQPVVRPAEMGHQQAVELPEAVEGLVEGEPDGASLEETTRTADEEALRELRSRLEHALVLSGLGKIRLAMRAGLSRTTVHNAFATTRPAPSARTVVLLANALRLPYEELLELQKRAAG
ncbi:hypothetical protein ACFZDG_29830 [Kitasatospora xanthocidica]|uniref:hypothetical protein n=1 Tax=Kitasatospora xanthocidica TaxID=83382 RepID=UPI0036E24949